MGRSQLMQLEKQRLTADPNILPSSLVEEGVPDAHPRLLVVAQGVRGGEILSSGQDDS